MLCSSSNRCEGNARLFPGTPPLSRARARDRERVRDLFAGIGGWVTYGRDRNVRLSIELTVVHVHCHARHPTTAFGSQHGAGARAKVRHTWVDGFLFGTGNRSATVRVPDGNPTDAGRLPHLIHGELHRRAGLTTWNNGNGVRRVADRSLLRDQRCCGTHFDRGFGGRFLGRCLGGGFDRLLGRRFGGFLGGCLGRFFGRLLGRGLDRSRGRFFSRRLGRLLGGCLGRLLGWCFDRCLGRGFGGLLRRVGRGLGAEHCHAFLTRD